MSVSEPQKTPFYDIHEQSGAKLIDFGGFMMPVQYTGIKKEHEAVRNSCGMFDVSHMGEIFFTGPNALAAVQHLTVNDAAKLVPGKAQYSAMCYENGGIVDDLLVYMLAEERYMLVVNASNKDKDLAWMLANNPHGAEITDASADMCLLAVQGPKCVEVLQPLTETDLAAIKFYTFNTGTFAGFGDVILSATGYTGEKGFEIYFDRTTADPAAVWQAILKSAETAGVELLPAGLGARDTLRLEMGYALYGNDITQDTNPLEAGLGWITKFDKGAFIGKEALLAVKEAGVSRRLVGFITENKRDIPRNGYRILDAEGAEIGFVTSGTQSVTEVKGIGTGYVKTAFAANGSQIFIEIRGKALPATVSKPPFVKKA
ncbi:MAG: glycine cleavage system aminomethyltransferase GcvT [Balneolales bacterium]|nr:glycine cleavage system aminomethyltransferase GcvT [Balneolales bacterium]